MASTLGSPHPGDDPAAPDRANYAEQRVFTYSPFNPWITAGLFYGVLIGAYALAALIGGQAWIDRTPRGAFLNVHAREALVLAFIACAILALQRYSHLKEREEAPSLARVLDPDVSWAPESFSPGRLRLMTAVGAGLSLAVSLLYLPKNPDAGSVARFLWFTGMSVLLSMLFFRGLELTRMGARHTAQVVKTLKVDLLRVDLLYPWGRAAARTSLIWFTVSAATCLLFVGSGVTIYTAFLLLGCAAIGVWVFVGTLSLIHHRIRQAKAAALDELRTEITDLKTRLHDDPAAPAKLQSILAYEARIAAAPEWPFDQTILVRLGASALILTVPWFGQAFAGLVVEHLGKVMQ